MINRSDLTTEELQILNLEFAKRGKSSGTLWILWLFLGSIGAHRFYLGHPIGWLYASLSLLGFVTFGVTTGITGLMVLIDAFLNSKRLAAANEKTEQHIIAEIRARRTVAAGGQATVTLAQ